MGAPRKATSDSRLTVALAVMGWEVFSLGVLFVGVFVAALLTATPDPTDIAGSRLRFDPFLTFGVLTAAVVLITGITAVVRRNWPLTLIQAAIAILLFVIHQKIWP